MGNLSVNGGFSIAMFDYRGPLVIYLLITISICMSSTIIYKWAIFHSYVEMPEGKLPRKRCLLAESHGCLVVTGTWLDYDFRYIGNVIIPTDELHHFSEG